MVSPAHVVLARMLWGGQDAAVALADLVDPSVFQTKESRLIFLLLAREAPKGFSAGSLRPLVTAEIPQCETFFGNLVLAGSEWADSDDSSHEALAEAVAAWGRIERLKRAAKDTLVSLGSNVPFVDVRNRLDKQLTAIDLASLTDQPFDDKADMQRRVNEFLSNENRGGLRFGIQRLDKRVTPRLPGNFTLVAGRPGTGKSTVMRNLARNDVKIQREPTAYFSLEMVGEETLPWFACMDTGLAYTDYVERNFTAGQRSMFDRALDWWVKNPLLILNEKAEVSPEWALRQMKRYRAQGITNFYFDYLHRAAFDTDKSGDLRLPVAKFGKQLKTFAVDNRSTVTAGAQLTKGDPHDEPSEEMIRETGNLIDEADKILLVWLQQVAGRLASDGTFLPTILPNGGRILAADAGEDEEIGEDDGRVYLKVGKQRVRKVKGFIAIPYNAKSGAMYEESVHTEERVA